MTDDICLHYSRNQSKLIYLALCVVLSVTVYQLIAGRGLEDTIVFDEMG